MNRKWLQGALVGCLGMWGKIPELVRELILICALLATVDTITGMACAWFEGKMRSRKITNGLIIKLLQFTGLVTIFASAAWFANEPRLILIPLLMIAWIESTSIIENIYKMEKFGGVKFPPWARNLIARLAKGLQVAAETQSALIVKSVPEHNTKTEGE